MKKIGLIFLCFVFLIVQYTGIAVAAEDTSISEVSIEKELYLLNRLEITSLQEDINLWKDEAMTRGEFAEYVAKAFKLTTVDNIYFFDVTREYWAYSYINALADSGCISVPENRKFEPERAITYAEAIKIVLSACGYGVYAENLGGFPLGYIEVAHKCGLGVDNRVGNTPITKAEVVKLIYDSLTMGYYSPVRFSDLGNMTQFEETDKSILRMLWNVDIGRGRLEAYYGAAIDNKKAKENELIIDNIRYTFEVNNHVSLDDRLCNYIEFIYEADNEEKGGKVFYVEDVKDKNDDLIIDASTISKFTLGKAKHSVNYYIGDRQKSISFSSSSDVIYNGSEYDGSLDAVMKEFTQQHKKGSVRLKDIDNDDLYDCVIIDSYRNFVIGYADANEEAIYNKYLSSDVIKISDYDAVVIINSSKRLYSVDYENLGVLVSVAESKDSSALIIRLCTTTVKGKIDEIYASDDRYQVIVDGADYLLDYDFYINAYGDALSLEHLIGTNQEIYLDMFGEVGYINNISGEYNNSIGYIIAAEADNSIMSAGVKFKLLMEDGSVKFLDAAKKLTIDGVRYKSTDHNVYAALKKGAEITPWTSANIAGYDLAQIVRYKLDADGNIIYLDTAYKGERESESNTLQRIVPVDNMTRFHYRKVGNYAKFSSNILIDSANTQVVMRPRTNADGELVVSTKPGTFSGNIIVAPAAVHKDSSIIDMTITDRSGSKQVVSDDMYYMGKSSMFKNDNGYYVNAYKFDSSSLYADVILHSYECFEENLSAIVFDEKIEKLGENGQVTDAIVGWENGYSVTYEVSDASDISSLKRGDIIYSWINPEKTKLCYITRIYDSENRNFENRSQDNVSASLTCPEYWWLLEFNATTTYNYWSKFTLTKGKVIKKLDNVVQWDWDGEFDTIEETMDLSAVPVLIVDHERRNDKIRVGSVADIADFESVGYNTASDMVFFIGSSVPKMAIVYVNN